ncbi:MAG: glycosyltransferase family 2 protein [Bacteroidales bacterium]|nr:glycosyltransferase family 2 protein [Bacteroidales bacterium]
MNNIPTISIIVPVYNAESYLERCLDSILVQSFKDFELILINDGSTDRSGDICNKYSHKDDRIRVFHSRNLGHGGARNIGLDNAKGEYIGWVDADDWIEPDMFETLYNYAREYMADITECIYIEHTGRVEKRSRPVEKIVNGRDDLLSREFFTARMSPHFWNKLYRKEVFAQIRFPVGRIHIDFYANVWIALQPFSYVRIPEARYHYINRDNNITNTFNGKQIREAIYLYDYTIGLADKVAKTDRERFFLYKDAITRLLARYFHISVNSKNISQKVYNRIVRKRLGYSLVKYIMTAKLPLKTRISYILLHLNMKGLQVFLHNLIGHK